MTIRTCRSGLSNPPGSTGPSCVQEAAARWTSVVPVSGTVVELRGPCDFGWAWAPLVT